MANDPRNPEDDPNHDRLADLSDARVSVWLDDLSRELLVGGGLSDVIENGRVVGVASTVGMTFQVFDTNLQTKAIRRTALRHGLISFPLGTVIIATSIDLVAGLANQPRVPGGRLCTAGCGGRARSSMCGAG